MCHTFASTRCQQRVFFAGMGEPACDWLLPCPARCRFDHRSWCYLPLFSVVSGGEGVGGGCFVSCVSFRLIEVPKNLHVGSFCGRRPALCNTTITSPPPLPRCIWKQKRHLLPWPIEKIEEMEAMGAGGRAGEDDETWVRIAAAMSSSVSEAKDQ